MSSNTILYAVATHSSFQAYLIAAVVVGASLGHYIFGGTMNADAILGDSNGGKGMACH